MVSSLLGSEGSLTLPSVYDLYLSLCTQVTTQAAKIKSLKAQVKKLKKSMPFQSSSVKLGSGHEGKTDKVVKREKVTAQQQSIDSKDEFTDIAKSSITRAKLKYLTSFKRKGKRTTSTRSVLTLKPLPKIDPNDKGKNRIEEDEESDTQSKEITEAKKKFDQIAHDEEVPRKIQEEWEAEEERKRITEEEATKTVLSNKYDFIQERIEADRLLVERVQEAEREQFIVEERAKNQFRNPCSTKN
ncbi:hypothetical protein Tco_0497352 [Tanacetum coccineum]